MARYFAELGTDNIVIRVIVIEPEMLALGHWGDPKNFVETEYDAKEGNGLNKNYAGIGHSYDKTAGGFVPPKPFPSWNLDQQKAVYVAPKPIPDAAKPYQWNEQKQEWVLPASVAAVDPLNP